MKRAFTPGLKVARNTVLRRKRELSVRGEILKCVGDKVSHAEVVARAILPGDLQIVRLAERLGINPEEVSKGLKVKVGDQIKPGDILCEHAGLFGWFKSQYKSNTAGEVDFVAPGTGHIGIRGASRGIELLAYIDGEVVQIEEGKSIVIEARAALAQGIFGVGGEKTGVLRRMNIDPDTEVSIEHIPEDIKGALIYGGKRPSAEALKLAVARGAVGFVTGSIDDRALASFLGFDLGIAMTGDEEIPMSLIITEGFGSLPMSRRVFDLLGEFEGKNASLNGATQVRAGAVRPEIIVTHGETVGGGAQVEEHATLAVGSSVRIIRFPYFGQMAKVLSLPHAPQKIETGALTRVLKAELSDGRVVTVPRANVEML